MIARVAVAPNDAVWLQDSATNRMVIHGLYTTDRIDLDTARAIFQARVIEAGHGETYPRFRKRVVRIRGRWYWEDDPDFDITRHMVPAPITGHCESADLQEYIATIAHTPLPDDRPPWRIEYIEDFNDGESAFIVRVHHAMADGIAFIPIIFALMDALGPAPRSSSAEPRNVIEKVKAMVLAPVAIPLVLLERALWRPDRHALHGRPVGGQKRVSWSRKFPLDQVKSVKNRFGATVNDVLMALVSGGIGRFLEAGGGGRVPYIRVSMPVNMRAAGSPLRMENRFAAVPLKLPSSPPTLPERIAAVKSRMDALKTGHQPIAIYGAVNLFLTALPYGVSRRLIDFFANKCTSVITNVPGPQKPLALGGRRLRTLMFWVPQRADIGIGISILTFGGDVQVGVIADTSILSDPGKLVDAIEQEFDELTRHVSDDSRFFSARSSE